MLRGEPSTGGLAQRAGGDHLRPASRSHQARGQSPVHPMSGWPPLPARCPPPTPTHRVQTLLAPQAGAQDGSSEVPAQPPWRLLSAARGSCTAGMPPLGLVHVVSAPFRGAAAQCPWQTHCLCRAPPGRSRLHPLCRVLPRPHPSRPALKTSNSRPSSGSSAWQTPRHRWKREKFLLSYRPRDNPGGHPWPSPTPPRASPSQLLCHVVLTYLVCGASSLGPQKKGPHHVQLCAP